jgi:hypothetical protein
LSHETENLHLVRAFFSKAVYYLGCLYVHSTFFFFSFIYFWTLYNVRTSVTSVCRCTVPVVRRLCIFLSAPITTSQSTEGYQNPRSSVFLDKPTFFFSASQEISCFLWGPKICCHIVRGLFSLGVRQINPVNVLSSYFLKIYFNVLPSASRFSSCLLMFLNLNPVCVFLLRHNCPIPRPSQPPYSDYPKNIVCTYTLMIRNVSNCAKH